MAVGLFELALERKRAVETRLIALRQSDNGDAGATSDEFIASDYRKGSARLINSPNPASPFVSHPSVPFAPKISASADNVCQPSAAKS